MVQRSGLRSLSAPLLALLDLVYPPRCAGCEGPLTRQSELLCRECWASLSSTGGRRCPLCSCPLASDQDPVGDGEGGQAPADCPNCADWAPYFDRLLVMAPFEGPAQQAIHALKFKQNKRLGVELGRRIALCEDLRDGLAAVDLLLPVPLHPARQRERGYNQSLLLAQGMSGVLDIPIENNILRRRRPTLQQATLAAGVRHDNLRGAFEMTDGIHPDLHVALVDDVVTTGATLDACARALKEAG